MATKVKDWEEGEYYFFPSRKQIGVVLAGKEGKGPKKLLIAKDTQAITLIPLVQLNESFDEAELITMTAKGLLLQKE